MSIGELKREIWEFELEANLGLSFLGKSFLLSFLVAQVLAQIDICQAPCKIVQAFWWLAVPLAETWPIFVIK